MTIHRWQGTTGSLGDAASYSSGIAPSVAATGILTLTANPIDTETVTIDGKAYVFQTTLTDVDGHVLIGTTASDSLDNLIAAIMLGDGADTLYANSTTLHPTVTAAVGAGDTMNVAAKVKGSDANVIATIENLTNGSWGSGTLSGGTQWAITDKVTWDKSSAQAVTSGIGPASPVVRVALAWVEEGYKEDLAAFDFAPDKLVHQGPGRMNVDFPTFSLTTVIVVDSANSIEAMFLDGPSVAGVFLTVKRGKLTVASTFDTISFINVLTGGEAVIPASANEIRVLRIDGGLCTNYRNIAPGGGDTSSAWAVVAGGALLQEGDQGVVVLNVQAGGSVVWNSTALPGYTGIHNGGFVDFDQNVLSKAGTMLEIFPGGIIRAADHISWTFRYDYRNAIP